MRDIRLLLSDLAPRRGPASEWLPRRRPPERCRECGAATNHWKPYCDEHVLLMPYARRLAKVVQREEEEATQRPSAGHVVAMRLLRALRDHPTALSALAHARLRSDRGRAYLSALSRAGLVRLRLEGPPSRNALFAEVTPEGHAALAGAMEIA